VVRSLTTGLLGRPYRSVPGGQQWLHRQQCRVELFLGLLPGGRRTSLTRTGLARPGLRSRLNPTDWTVQRVADGL
jgi:hypothetical protein